MDQYSWRAALGTALVAAAVVCGTAAGVDGPGPDAVTLAARLAVAPERGGTAETARPAPRADVPRHDL